MGPIMCYADTATENDNTVTAAAETHQNAPDVIDDTAAVAA
ncbi:hypothetical protein ATK36_5357 [Amycolatopsis sulphurea]|uniref:Uncharacterized protein n=2 Tax=Amycolatopsis sulphurea TaxID=76022 RepID=A0A2A9FHD5_9PSEU|nr:hypothetical protein ATK36_5357 [Amycolatopsis sulphurea]